VIIQGAAGDDRAKIQEMEYDLCRKHRVGKKLLYPILQQADFHRTYSDPPEFWTTPAYAAFSGVLLNHKLGFEQLNSLHSDFTSQRLLMHASWGAVAARELMEKKSYRSYRNHTAIAYRYACAVADDYMFPEPDLLGRFSAQQYEQFNSYLDFVCTKRKIAAGKHVRQACARHLADLAKSLHEACPNAG
jgi:hypothetical protein